MNVNGEYRIPTSRERVWEALHDPEVLRACIPGCEELRRLSETEFEGRLIAQVGAVTTAFAGRMTLTEEKYPDAWAMIAQVRSASAGWADGQATVTLTAETGGTVVGYRARVEPGGRLASVGGRLLHGVAIRNANEFFTRLIERLRPHPLAAEPQELAEPVTGIATRLVTPLAPTTAPPDTPPASVVATSRAANEAAYQDTSPTPGRQNRILIIGMAIWSVIFACLFWPWG
jgi:carbon monoxide dehydrogenase subunit G